MTAAPLKLSIEQFGERTAQLFPRLNDRGPIEARRRPLRQFGVPVFPRLNDRGPIEASGRPFLRFC